MTGRDHVGGGRARGSGEGGRASVAAGNKPQRAYPGAYGAIARTPAEHGEPRPTPSG